MRGSFSGIRSIAGVRPEGPGPRINEYRSCVEVCLSVSVKHHCAPGLAGSDVTHPNSRCSSNRCTKHGTSHSPIAGCALEPMNDAPIVRPVDPPAHLAPRDSSLYFAEVLRSITSGHTTDKGASTSTSTKVPGPSLRVGGSLGPRSQVCTGSSDEVLFICSTVRRFSSTKKIAPVLLIGSGLQVERRRAYQPSATYKIAFPYILPSGSAMSSRRSPSGPPKYIEVPLASSYAKPAASRRARAPIQFSCVIEIDK